MCPTLFKPKLLIFIANLNWQVYYRSVEVIFILLRNVHVLGSGSENFILKSDIIYYINYHLVVIWILAVKIQSLQSHLLY